MNGELVSKTALEYSEAFLRNQESVRWFGGIESSSTLELRPVDDTANCRDTVQLAARSSSRVKEMPTVHYC